MKVFIYHLEFDFFNRALVNLIFYLEVSPLFVIEILHRAFDIFEDYFNECTETSLKENFVIVYEVN
jgi:hypothetical protein